jgi:hypothetical protein
MEIDISTGIIITIITFVIVIGANCALVIYYVKESRNSTHDFIRMVRLQSRQSHKETQETLKQNHRETQKILKIASETLKRLSLLTGMIFERIEGEQDS